MAWSLKQASSFVVKAHSGHLRNIWWNAWRELTFQGLFISFSAKEKLKIKWILEFWRIFFSFNQIFISFQKVTRDILKHILTDNLAVIMKQTVPDHNLSQFSNKKRWFSDLLRCHWFLVLLAWSISIFFYKIFYPENSVLDCGTKCSTYRIMKCVKRKFVKLPLLTRDHRLEIGTQNLKKLEVASRGRK